MITLISKAKRQIVTPTMFPDGTSQVWKLDLAGVESAKIIWDFEQEAELIWVNQLIALLTAEKIAISELFIPYLPYARQDKPVGNSATFAKSVFLSMLNKAAIGKITTLDAHSDIESKEVFSYAPTAFIKQALAEFKPDIVVFPDKGANFRYNRTVNVQDYDILVLDKVRNQGTGEITGLSIDETWSSNNLVEIPKHNTRNKPLKLLIIDDICDGGATFNQAAIFLHQRYQCEIALYVTHGIFSKGFDKMIASGISQFFTTQSLKKNKDGFAIDFLIE
jgi:ribose-phosphate pyrophosphokinase